MNGPALTLERLVRYAGAEATVSTLHRHLDTGGLSVSVPGGYPRVVHSLAGVAVPLYLHPVLSPAAWEVVTDMSLGTGFVVVNAADGPGRTHEAAYVRAIEPLLAAGQPVVGYVDHGYGSRRPDEVVRDAAAWQRLYGVRAVFLDRVPTAAAQVIPTARLVRRLHALGVQRVVLNPGAVPADGDLADLADDLVVFEGPWRDHVQVERPAWADHGVRARLVHLVHSLPRRVPPHSVADHAVAAGASIVGLSLLRMPNPWADLPVWTT